jgi:nicotinate phosphoribosyltransferase
MCNPLDAKKTAMKIWLEAFDGDAGIALTDTFTTDHFLKIFNKMLANAYGGVRHDSGPWDVWAKKILNHYESMSIDAKTKTLLFSDGLNCEKMVEIYNSLKNYTQVGFGIGTNMTNDLGLGVTPLPNVIKMTKCNGVDVLKLSDDNSKSMSKNKETYEYLKRTFIS